MKNDMKINWKEIDILIDNLSKQILESDHKFDNIYGIPRGGLIPAVMLSYRTNLPLPFEISDNTLVVDEIIDTGKTIHNILQKYKDVKTLSIYVRYNSTFIPDFYGKMIYNDKWLTFPW